MSSPRISSLRSVGSPSLPRGTALSADPLLNKGTAFTGKERDALGLRGLLPPRIYSLDEQVVRAYTNFLRQPAPIDRYVFLTLLQNRNEILFFKVLETYPEEMIPIIYTPTVGQACFDYGVIFRRTRGMFVSIRERGRIAEVLRHWPQTDVSLPCIAMDPQSFRARETMCTFSRELGSARWWRSPPRFPKRCS